VPSIFPPILSLNRGTTKYGKAPHKPILLLAVIEIYASGDLIENRIDISSDLVLKFRGIWDQLVKTQHVPTFAVPFFHLQNEKGGWWQLVTFLGKRVWLTNGKSIKSFNALVEAVAYAKLSPTLYSIMIDPVKREVLKKEILEAYFANSIHDLLQDEKYKHEIEHDILYDPEENYARKVKKKLEALPPESREMEIFVRSMEFPKAVLKVYDHRCAITGIKVEFSKPSGLIDACHIEPHAETHLDTIKNGIALSPTFHRAFDLGIVAISDDFTILVSRKLRDLSKDNSIAQFDRKPLYLPKEEIFYPSQDKLKDHRRRFGF
jgi:putative restriction endonuclease